MLDWGSLRKYVSGLWITRHLLPSSSWMSRIAYWLFGKWAGCTQSKFWSLTTESKQVSKALHFRTAPASTWDPKSITGIVNQTTFCNTLGESRWRGCASSAIKHFALKNVVCFAGSFLVFWHCSRQSWSWWVSVFILDTGTTFSFKWFAWCWSTYACSRTHFCQVNNLLGHLEPSGHV